MAFLTLLTGCGLQERMAEVSMYLEALHASMIAMTRHTILFRQLLMKCR
jgi:hypothetical protein